MTFLHHGACTEAEEKTRLQGKHQKEYTKFFPRLGVPWNGIIKNISPILQARHGFCYDSQSS